MNTFKKRQHGQQIELAIIKFIAPLERKDKSIHDPYGPRSFLRNGWSQDQFVMRTNWDQELLRAGFFVAKKGDDAIVFDYVEPNGETSWLADAKFVFNKPGWHSVMGKMQETNPEKWCLFKSVELRAKVAISVAFTYLIKNGYLETKSEPSTRLSENDQHCESESASKIDVSLGDEDDDRSTFFEKCRFATFVRIEFENKKELERPPDSRAYWPGLGSPWEATTGSWSNKEIREILEYCLSQSKTLTLNWIATKCNDGATINDDDDLKAWNRFLRLTLNMLSEMDFTDEDSVFNQPLSSTIATLKETLGMGTASQLPHVESYVVRPPAPADKAVCADDETLQDQIINYQAGLKPAIQAGPQVISAGSSQQTPQEDRDLQENDGSDKTKIIEAMEELTTKSEESLNSHYKTLGLRFRKTPASIKGIWRRYQRSLCD